MLQVIPRSMKMTITITRMRKTALGMLTGVTAFWCGVALLSPSAEAQGYPEWLRSENSPFKEKCAAERPDPLGFPGERLQNLAVNTSSGVTLDEIYLRANAVILYNKLYDATTRAERESLQERLLQESPYAKARARVAQARGSQPGQWYQNLREWRRNNVTIAHGAPDDIGDPNRRGRSTSILNALGYTPTEFYRSNVIMKVRQAGGISHYGGESIGCDVERRHRRHMENMEDVKDWMRRNHRM